MLQRSTLSTTSPLEQTLSEIRNRLASIEDRLKPTPTAVSLSGAAAMLSCSPRHIARLVQAGTLRVHMVGRLRRIAINEVQALLTAPPPPSRAPPPPKAPPYSAAKELEKFRARRR